MLSVEINKLSNKQIDEMGIRSWPIWEKEISKFDWTYSDTEQCLILEGEFNVETKEGIFKVVAGDFVIFKKGLTCVWDITKPVRKHYNFI